MPPCGVFAWMKWGSWLWPGIFIGIIAVELGMKTACWPLMVMG
jgi:hypothetical protein